MKEDFVFYHGGASNPTLRKIRKACPEIKHGNGWTPNQFYEREHPYFLDNGAFTGDFNSDEWINMLERVAKFKNKPDFVVLPDKLNNPSKTWERSKKYVFEVIKRNLPFYYVAQKPESYFQAVHKAVELDADGVFVGGDWAWKQRESSKIVDYAHDNGLKVHIGMPGNYFFPYIIGADSMDSVSVGRNESYCRVRSLSNMINMQKNVLDYTDKRSVGR